VESDFYLGSGSLVPVAQRVFDLKRTNLHEKYVHPVLGKSTVCRKPAARQIRKLTLELLGYLRNNSDSLPNYGRRYRAGRRISSAFVESAVNQLIDKRMSKSQQMRWDPRSAHLLLQVRVRVIDGQLRDDFARWYRGFPSNASTMPLAA